ncbi:Glyoxylase, beta-lactamase superfamily II [Ectothiorhodospira magna]|uniref:Glyoxylase, beta-lactamase superfamily II n=1 Tax=Ectothiorhodospira magna TaxID=867345 RepID=A0A1H9FQN9_9GAMM|nr:MBL fold metallo-hydrolase [Ectothiorhodospira magna]SEQ39738.1 Glyoxylase, beta-lactamase superfamily II [Ectothiorhodospira magna]
MIFRQLFEPVSSTYTYLIGCEQTGKAVLVDPVLPAWQRDLEEVRRLGLELAFTVDTHIHADHITSARKLKLEAGSRIAHPAMDQLSCVDHPLQEGQPLTLGGIVLEPIFTPGHTDGHHAYRVGERVLTGDALLIDGCGRTDFQNGDARALYHSVRHKLFALPEDTLVFPGHDYNKRRVSSIAQEKARNPRLGGDRDLEGFIKLMDELDLAYPKFIDYAVPGNRECGVCPPDVPESLDEYCDQIGDSQQG